MSTVIINYRVGNMGSVLSMLKKIGVSAEISDSPEAVRAADRLILPGVGHFDHGVKSLRELGLFDVLNERVIGAKVPFLGICVGMQLLTRGSEEGELPGLGWIPSSTVKFRPETVGPGLKIPHVGWNFVKPKVEGGLFAGMDPEETRFYFTHSYYVKTDDPSDTLATAEYGHDFAASVRRDNVWGVQFHPEKSHRYGLGLFRNFMENCR